jgi:predicted enzyme related to lactoylglutathione lyase
LKDESYICHIIIPSKNHQKSKRFYEKAFDWKVEPQPGTTSLDVLPTSGKGISAELNLEESTIVPSIYTVNIEATLKRIEKLGGTILKNKTPIGKQGEHGYFALFKDPNGNKMCLYSKK